MGSKACGAGTEPFAFGVEVGIVFGAEPGTGFGLAIWMEGRRRGLTGRGMGGAEIGIGAETLAGAGTPAAIELRTTGMCEREGGATSGVGMGGGVEEMIVCFCPSFVVSVADCDEDDDDEECFVLFEDLLSLLLLRLLLRLLRLCRSRLLLLLELLLRSRLLLLLLLLLRLRLLLELLELLCLFEGGPGDGERSSLNLFAILSPSFFHTNNKK